MQLADRQNWSLTEAKRKTTSSELLLWKAYIEKDTNHFHRDDYYLAQIACEIRRSRASNPKSIKLEDFLLKFNAGQEKKQESIETATMRSKLFWFGLTGLDSEIKKE